MKIMKTTKDLPLESFFEALADRTRLRLINLLARGEICVCYFVETLGEGQPKISRHLAYLRERGLVEVRRDGKWMHYSLSRPEDEGRATLLDAVLDAVAEDAGMQRDVKRLASACCAVRLPETLQRAPRPVLRG